MSDPRLLEEFRLADQARKIFAALNWSIEPWVALRLARTEGEFLKREVDEVRVVATRFINTLVQQAVALEFLPVTDIRGVQVPGAPPPESFAADKTEFLFEPTADDIIGYLLGHYLNILIHVVLLNAKASEQSARMVSMKAATDSAVQMIKDLTLEYNKLRQGRITQELLEIAGGQAQ